MKRLYLGTGLLAVMLIMGICLTAAFSAIHQPLSEALRQAKAAAVEGDWEKAGELVEKTRENWDRHRHFTAAVADHEPLEQIDSLLARLEVLCRLREADEFSADCVELARLMEAMADSQRLTWWNLL